MNTRTRRNAVLVGLLALVATLLTVLPAPAAEIGTNDFQISQQTQLAGVGMSGVAYNSATDQYLVVWEGTDPAVAGKAEIRGQLLDGRTGAAVGPDDFLVASVTGDADTDAHAPDVVYNPARNEFVVVFIADEFDEAPPLIVDTLEVYAQRVSAAGAPVGARLRVSDMGDDDANGSFDAGSALQLGPEIALNATDNQYLVVWHGDDNTGGLVNGETEIFGQRLAHSAGGDLVETGANDVQLSDVGGANGIGAFDAREPSVAWNSTNNEYLVAWQADDNEGGAIDNRFHIWGQRVSAAGAPVGANDFRISTVGGVADDTVETFSPDVAYNPTLNEYLVVWEGDAANGTAGTANEFEIWGQRLAGAAGAAVGGNIQISQMGTPGSAAFTATVASAAYNPGNQEYLVIWRGDTNTGGLVDDEVEIFGTRRDGTVAATIEPQARLSDMGPNGTPNPVPQVPAVAYSERAVNDYLVTWAGENPGVTAAGESEVWGQLVAPASDLQLTKTAAPANPATGDTVTYTLTYSNAGPDTALDVVITDPVPAQLTNPAFTSTGPTPVARPGTTFVWDIASLASGQGGTITVTGTVAAGTADGTVIDNTATISTGTVAPDPNAGNNSDTASVTVDSPPRLVSINRAGASPTGAASVDFTVTFTEPVTGVTASNFALATTGAVTGAAITGVTGTGATRTVTVGTGAGDGTLGLDMVNGTGVVDTSGKPLVTTNLPFTGQAYTIDRTRPTLALTSTAPDPTNTSPIPVTATFSEPVTGFTADEIVVGNGTVTGFTGSGAAYTFNVVPAGQGQVTVDVAAGVATDAAGNTSLAADRLTRLFDSVRPSVTVEQATTQDDPTDTGPILFDVEFSEPVTGFTGTDVTLSGTAGATTAVVTGAGSTYQVAVSGMTGSGTVTASVQANAGTDAAGNLSQASTSTDNTVTFVANAAPVIAVAPGSACLADGRASRIALTISDPDQDPLTVAVTTSNPAVVPLSGISVDDQAPDQSVTITPVIQTTAGSSLVTLTASDGASSAQLTIMVVVGTDEADTLTGTGDAELVVAGSGADTVASLGGPDLVCGGQGADQIDGGPGADTLDGSRGNDLLSGQAGDDTLLGGQGVDQLTGGADADAFSGGPGPDVLTDFTPAEGDTSDGT